MLQKKKKHQKTEAKQVFRFFDLWLSNSFQFSWCQPILRQF